MRRLLLAAALACLVLPALAIASWNGSGSGKGYSKATALAAGNAPTAVASGRNVTVTWSAAAAGAPVSDYLVKRYAAGGAADTIKSNCSGAISGLSCTEQGVPAGDWTYTVTPRNGNWRGVESNASGPVTVGPAVLQLSGSSSVANLPATLSGSISDFVGGQTVSFRLDNPTAGQTLSGSITPSPTPANGSASVSLTVPSGTALGSHTIYAIGNAGDVASAPITVVSTSTISTTAWNLRDASSGSESDQSDVFAFNDARVGTTTAFANGFSNNRYIEFDLNAPLASGLTVSGPNFNFRFADSTANKTACFYFEAVRASTNAVLATHGNGQNPIGCNSTTTQQTFTTPLPEVNSSDIANDLRIRVYAYESGKNGVNIDLATVSGSTSQVAFTLYDSTMVDVADRSAATFPWPIATAGDGVAYPSLANWGTSFAAGRYLKLTFPSYVPVASTLTNASFKHSYRSSTTGTTCWYFEVYSGATLIGTHGSSSAPVSCNSTTAYVTDTTPLPEVNNAARANGLTIKLYVRNSGSLKSADDLDSLTLNYIG